MWWQKHCTFVIFQPAGVFILENSHIQYEVCTGVPFAFSVTFRDEPDHKHLFSGRSEDCIHQWVAAMRQATYVNLPSGILSAEYTYFFVSLLKPSSSLHFHCVSAIFCSESLFIFRYGCWRSQLIILQTKIKAKTGKVRICSVFPLWNLKFIDGCGHINSDKSRKYQAEWFEPRQQMLMAVTQQHKTVTQD